MDISLGQTFELYLVLIKLDPILVEVILGCLEPKHPLSHNVEPHKLTITSLGVIEDLLIVNVLYKMRKNIKTKQVVKYINNNINFKDYDTIDTEIV